MTARTALGAFPLLAALSTIALSDDGQRRMLAEGPAPADNPLKGFVPYASERADPFPHSMEFNYLPLGDLVRGPDEFEWGPMERLLDDIAGRGHQAVVRIYMEYPDKTDGIPRYLIDDGLRVERWLDTGTEPFPPAHVETPDYEDPRLRRLLRAFIAAFGDRFDGDPRLGFLTAGLLGVWGEWHTYPREELFASKAVQAEVMDAFEAAFDRTPVLLRYPAGPENFNYAPNHDRPTLGYHDDSFAWATLETGRPDDSWFFNALLRDAGPGALERWKTAPIGGEIRPELWGKIFDADPEIPEAQDFERCVETTHATWLMDTGMFREGRPGPPDRVDRALEAARSLGYTFQVVAATIPRVAEPDSLPIRFELTNRGVAPFYADWPLELAVLDEGGTIADRQPSTGALIGLLPGDQDRVIDDRLGLGGLAPGPYRVLLRVVNPLPGGLPLRFANADQDVDLDGWLTLGAFEIPAR